MMIINFLFPFPGNFMMAWFEPWKTDNFINGVIQIAHKPIIDDVFRMLYPYRILAIDLIKNFQPPLWNPYNGSGTPLLAVMHPGLLNPMGIVFFFFPNHIAWTLFLCLQILFLGLFTYIYCRKIAMSYWGALFSSVILIFSGYVTARLEYGEFLYGLSMLPLLLYLIESNKLIFTPLAVSFLFFSGQPHVIIYVLFLSSIYALLRLAKKRIMFYILMVFIGIALAAIQLAPSLELFWHSSIINSDSSQFMFKKFLLPIAHIITIFIPNYFGSSANYNYFGAGGDSIETMAYLGLIPTFFAILSLKKRSPMSKFFLITAIVSIMLTLSSSLSIFFYTLPIPVISAEAPSRFFMLTTFSLVILAGFGFDIWSRNKNFREFKVLTIIFSAIVFLLLIITFVIYQIKLPCPSVEIPQCRLISLRNTILESGVFTCFLILFTGKFIFKSTSRLWLYLIIAVVIVSGLYNSYKFLPFSTRENIMPDHEVINAIKTHTQDGRVLGIGNAGLAANLATYYRFFDPNYYEPLHIKRYAELIQYANTGAINNLSRSDVNITNEATVSADLNSRRKRLFQILSIKYLLYQKSEKSQSDDVVWQNNKWLLEKNNLALPKSYSVNKYTVEKDNEKSLKLLFSPDFVTDKEVILREEPDIILTEVSEASSFLVLTDTYYPGWSAYIDGKKTKIYEANYALRAVVVPEGIHDIRMVYEPDSFKLGIIITGLFFIIWIIILKICLKNN